MYIRSEIELNAPLGNSDIEPDINVKWAEKKTCSNILSSENVLAEFKAGNGYGYRISRNYEGYILEFRNSFQFTMSNDLKTIYLQPHTDFDQQLIPVFICGNIIAMVLALGGIHVLHASAVEYMGTAIAFAGEVGMGKSTIAALLCANGAKLITDDLLRLEYEDNMFLCHPGSPELRLRKNAASISKCLKGYKTSRSADGRELLICEWVGDSTTPLNAILIPKPSNSVNSLDIKRLTGAESMISLTANSKISGWRDRNFMLKQFEEMSAVARNVPVFEIQIPWGLPFSVDFVNEFINAVKAIQNGSIRYEY